MIARKFTVLCVAVGVILLFLATDTGRVTRTTTASHAGGAAEFSMDLNPAARPLNAAAALGTRQSCARISPNGVQDADEDAIDTLNVDITVSGIPASNGMTAFSYAFIYPETGLTVQSRNSNFLLGTNSGSAVFEESDPTPDTDADNLWRGRAFDFSTSGPETGSGVLQRLAISTDPGAPIALYNITFFAGDNYHVNSANDAFPPDVLNSAQIGVGVNCPLVDSDGDKVFDADEDACEADPHNSSIRPERVDGSFAVTDDDGDTLLNEALPFGSETFDCDGDGWTGTQELYIFSTSISGMDQDPCGNNGWPAELAGNNNILNIADINSFTTARPAADDDAHSGNFYTFNHTLDDDADTVIESNEDPGVPGGATYNVGRWNLQTPPHLPSTAINIGDLNSLTTGSGAYPPMFGGQWAFGQTCPWPP